jgi:hypothetical protein
MKNSFRFANGPVDNGPVDDDGRPVERTKWEYPYSYSFFVVWKSEQDKRGIPGLGDAYSDRLLQWDRDKYNRCAEAVWGDHRQMFGSSEVAEIEQFLRLYCGDAGLVLTCILEGCNVSSGYPLWFFRWQKGPKDDAPATEPAGSEATK